MAHRHDHSHDHSHGPTLSRDAPIAERRSKERAIAIAAGWGASAAFNVFRR